MENYGFISEIDWEQYDDDSVFAPFPFVWKKNAEDCPAQAYRLTEEGNDLLDSWYDDYSVGYDLCNGRAKGLARDYSPYQIFEKITNDTRLSVKV